MAGFDDELATLVGSRGEILVLDEGVIVARGDADDLYGQEPALKAHLGRTRLSRRRSTPIGWFSESP